MMHVTSTAKTNDLVELLHAFNLLKNTLNFINLLCPELKISCRPILTILLKSKLFLFPIGKE